MGLVACVIVVTVIIIRQRKHQKLCSPAYSGFKFIRGSLAQDTSSSSGGGGSSISAKSLAVGKTGTLTRTTMTQTPAPNLAQAPNGNLYVTDAPGVILTNSMLRQKKPNVFAFPPPPALDYNGN